MSRIDDDRDAARVAERIALQKREQELKAKERSAQDSAFSKLVQKGQGEKQSLAQRQAATAQDAISRLKEQLGEGATEQIHSSDTSSSDAESRAAAAKQRSRLGDASFQEKIRRSQAEGQEQTTAGNLADELGQGMAAKGRADEGMSAGRASAGRTADSKKTSEALDEKGAQSAKGGKALSGKGELKADNEGNKGGGGQQNQGGGKDNPGAMPANFRFNPALMAPVPVAQKRDLAGSDRLRQIANEIAQKIVERVRVGTNKAGAAEFQIDLRSNVLKGLSIKVSSQQGKISMIFSGSDKDTLKFIEEQAEGLKQTLTGRGLKLQDLKFEATT